MADPGAGATGDGDETPARRAARCVERGIERYAEGRFDAAIAEFEAALAAQPKHPRATECLAWAREIVAGQRTLMSGSYAALNDEPPPAPAAPPPAVITTAPPPAAASELAAAPKSGRTILGLPQLELIHTPAPGRGHFEEVPDSVTREWSAAATGQNLPPLDVPELSEEQIAHLLDAGEGRGLTLHKGAAATPVTAMPPPSDPTTEPTTERVVIPDEPGDDENEEESTNVRLAHRVVELVAEPEDDEMEASEPGTLPAGLMRATPELTGLDPVLPSLTPPSAGTTPVPAVLTDGDAADEFPSEPTNPFVKNQLSEIAPTLMQKSDSGNTPLPAPVPPPPATGVIEVPPSWPEVRFALEQGDARRAFAAAEKLVQDGGGIDAASVLAEHELLRRVYEAVVGDLRAVPRFGKATPDLDSRSAFLLSRMDGTICGDDLLDVSGMKRLEALRVLAQLVSSGVVMMKK